VLNEESTSGTAEAGTEGLKSGDLIAKAKKEKEAAERKLQETLEVLKENVAGSSGEAIWASAASQVREESKKT
jgi:hypothetical protein